MGDVLATVAILTFNGDDYLREVLEAVTSQQLDGDFEILVIDSGSVDDSLRIIGDFPAVRLHEIPNSEFGHGKTRALAAQLARGEYIAFLTQDAIPVSSSWLREIIAPMRADATVGCVFGKQVARSTAFALQKYEIRGAFRNAGPDGKTTVYRKRPGMSESEVQQAQFFSDVNSAAVTRLLLTEVPFRDVAYAEDQLLAQDMLAAGYGKAYSPQASVIHSNDLTLSEYHARVFDESVGLLAIGLGMRIGVVRAAVGWFSGVFWDTARILVDKDLSWPSRFKWWFVNPVFHAARWSAIWSASRTTAGDTHHDHHRSLERKRRQRGVEPPPDESSD